MNGLTSTRRWNDVFSLGQGQIRIALYLVHHGNQATVTEIIQALTTQGKDNRKPESIERMIRQMKARNILKEQDGIVRLQNPRRYDFVIKWVRGNLLDRWVLLPLPLYVLGILVFNDSYMRVFLLVLFLIHCISVADDYLHIQKW